MENVIIFIFTSDLIFVLNYIIFGVQGKVSTVLDFSYRQNANSW